MSNLFASLNSSAGALQVVTEALAITQNNIMNAGSAGYAKQRPTLLARDFDPAQGLAGGVALGPVQSARDEYVERSVQLQNGKTAAAESEVGSLTKLEQALQLSSADSIPTAMNRLFQSFSAWAAAPEDLASKQNVVATAQELAASFNRTSQKLADLTEDNALEIRSTVDGINRLAGRIQEFNAKIRSGSAADAGIDAGIHATLDELGASANVQALRQADGTFTLLLGGEHPLVVGTQHYPLSVGFNAPPSPPAVFGDAPPPAQILNSSGQDVTSSIEDARLGALLQFRHETLAAVQGDSMREGEINRLAKKISDRVNEAWPPPSQPFFVYGVSHVAVAHTLAVNPAIAPALLDAAEPGPPPVANGKALALAELAKPVDANDKLDGQSFAEYFGGMGARVGSKLNDAKFEQHSHKQLSAQLESFRNQMSGVSIDEEALQMMQFQKAYQASARMVSVIDEMLEVAVNIGRR
jgi:flagellar hook-associated protein 1